MVKKKRKIRIKPENRGKFLQWCKRHGHASVTSSCIAAAKRSKDPRVRKMANFAANARKWKK